MGVESPGSTNSARVSLVFAILLAVSGSLPQRAEAAAIFFDNFSPQQAGWSFASPSADFLGWLNNNANVPGVTLTVNAPAADANGTLTFDLLGFNTLDGFGSCCPDVLTFTVNGATAFTAGFTGAVAQSGFITNPFGATMSNVFLGMGNGSIPSAEFAYQLVVPVALLAGVNTFTWTFSPLQSPGDEAWGLDNVTVASTVPEPAAVVLVGLGVAMASRVWRRRSRRT